MFRKHSSRAGVSQFRALTGLAFYVAGSTTAYAQTAGPAPAADVSQSTDIVVTGSNINRSDLAQNVPVLAIEGSAYKINNAATAEELLQVYPQFTPAGNSNSNNPGDGVATLDLRGLGPQRTLVLVDGRRWPTSNTLGVVDVDSIPVALIKRVDVLTGGASAVYGSDAVAGVVNFVLDDRFTGLEASAGTQITTRGDGAQRNASLTAGTKLGDRGNLVVSGEWVERDAVTFGARSRTAQAVNSPDLSIGGSGQTIPTVFSTGSGNLQVTPAGTLTANRQLYNYNAVNYAELPMKRYDVLALGRYDLTDGVEVYGRAGYSHTIVETNLAPTATNNYTFNIDPTNPFLSPAEQAVFFGRNATINDGSGVASDPTARAGTSAIGISRRVIEAGARHVTHTSRALQLMLGLRGDLGSNLRWDVYGQYNQTTRHQEFDNDLSYSALKNALDVVAGPGGPVCHSTLTAPSNGCVPLNLFGTTPISQAALNYVLRSVTQDTRSSEAVAGALLQGELVSLRSPFASLSPAFSAGVQYRRESARTSPDAEFRSTDLIYYGQSVPVGGHYDTKDAFAELKLPLVSDKPLVRSLMLETGARYSDYSTAGSVWAYKAGGSYEPISGIRLRGMYDRAVRAPNINELFSPDGPGTGNIASDPCAGTSVSAQTAAICVAQGAPASRIGLIAQPSGGQINTRIGGNPLLKPERSDTFTIGVLVQPARFHHLSLSVDYYDIRVSNAIAQTPAAVTMGQCFNIDRDPASAACSSIHRNTLDGSLGGDVSGVPSLLGNIARISTSGIDVAGGLNGGSAEGLRYALSVAGTYVRSYDVQSNPLSAAVACAGKFGALCNLQPMPRWKHVATATFGYRGLTATTRWRFIGAVGEDAGTKILVSRIPSFSYFDETVSVDIGRRLSLQAGIQNAFDKKPPVVGATVGNLYNQGNTFPGVYDVLGRTLFVRASVKI